MNKKRILTSIVVLFIILIVFLYSQKNTIKDVVEASPNLSYKIVHTDKIDNKSIVFYLVNENQLQFTVVQQDFFKYTAIYSGNIGDHERILDTFGILFIELPRQVMDDRLVCFGLLDNPSISEMSLTDDSDLVKALITETPEFNYWRAELTDIQSRNILINGYDSEGKKLLEVEEVLRQN